MIVIKQAAYDAMLAHARESGQTLPCGFLAGRIEKGVRIVHAFYPITNVADGRGGVSLDIHEQSRAMAGMSKLGVAVVGTWLCHRTLGSGMTAGEIQAAHDRDGSYLVMALPQGESPTLRSFRVWGGRADEEPLRVED